jgi:hypothetical protein
MNKWVFKLFFVPCILFFGNRTYGQKWVPLDGSTTGETITRQILQDDASSFKARIVVNGFYDQIQETKQGEFHQLSFDDEAHLMDIGFPSLPLFPQCIAIPEGTTLEPTIQEVKWVDVEMGRIFPVQEPSKEGEKAHGFAINEKAYGRPFIPKVMNVGNEMEWRGVRCAGVSVCPFKYYPSENRLSVLSEFVLQIDFSKDGQEAKEKLVYETDDPFNLFDNNIFRKKQPMKIGDVFQGNYNLAPNPKLLIIVGSGLDTIRTSSKMEEFCKWKVLRGFPVQVVSTATTGTTPASIKDYILQKYNYENVRYVLFVGDNNQIPMKGVASAVYGQSETIYSDYWYGCMGGDSDYLADVSVGRFPTDSLSEFSNMVDKSIRYERSYHAQDKVLLMAHKEGGSMPIYYQGCSEAIRTANYSCPLTFITAYGGSVAGTSATNADVIYHINQGASIINYRGHASCDFWGGTGTGDPEWNEAGESFYSSQINNMSDDVNAVFFSIACHTGNIGANGECMLETFMRSSHGAVGFIGATRATDTDMNNDYDKSLFQKLLNNSVWRLADLSVYAHARCITVLSANYLPAPIDNAQSYLVGGDPTLELWTAVPQDVGGVNFSMSENTATLTANITVGFSMPIIDDDFNFRGISHFSYDGGTFERPTFNFYIVINTHNNYPYIIYCNYSNDAVIKNTVFDYDAYYYGTPVTIGDLCPTYEDRDVVVKNGKTLFITKGSEGVTIANDFIVEKGAIFEIR